MIKPIEIYDDSNLICMRFVNKGKVVYFKLHYDSQKSFSMVNLYIGEVLGNSEYWYYGNMIIDVGGEFTFVNLAE